MSRRRAPLALLLAAPALAQDPAPADRADLAQSTPPPLGWLSDPERPPAAPLDALAGGKISLDNRFRVELADTSFADSASAVTNRLRLGYAAKPWRGVSAAVEIENVIALNEGDYFVPPVPEGDPRRTVIADPKGTVLNQLYARFATESLGDSGVALDLRAGRQRIEYDDERFIGDVGWRQFDQTFDALSAQTDLGDDRLVLRYAYLWGVERVFGPDGPSPDSDSHLVNLRFAAAPELVVTPFAYLLDFRGDEPLNSSNTFGVRLAGTLGADARDGSSDAPDVSLAYELTYARQSDAGDNPIKFDADFFAAQLTLARRDLGSLSAGCQILGSDDGAYGFRFPLGTNHAFQGFADNFLVTPADGLQDVYAGASAELAWGVQGSVVAHWFWSDEGSRFLGQELDLALAKKINENWSVLLKTALFDGDAGEPDVTRFWVQTEFRF